MMIIIGYKSLSLSTTTNILYTDKSDTPEGTSIEQMKVTVKTLQQTNFSLEIESTETVK